MVLYLLTVLTDCIYTAYYITTVETMKNGIRVLFKHYRGQYQATVMSICMVPLHL